VVDTLSAAGADCIVITRGPAFATFGPRAYALPPGVPAGYALLVNALAEDGFVPDTVLHCWTSDVRPIQSVAALEAAQHDGVLSVVGLTQALASRDAERRMTLVVASREAQVVRAGDAAGPHATLPGLLKTIPQELSGVVCRHVDLDDSTSSEAAAQALADEIATLDGESEIAYRDGVRYVSRLAPLDLATMPKRPLPFKPGGCYVVTGGLGALGSVVAGELLERFHARLLLLDRTRLDDSPAGGTARESAARLETLRVAGDVMYEAVDVADARAVGEAVDRARQRWQTDLDGIVHLAGEFEERLVTDETPAHVLAAMRAKVAGTWALRQLVSGRSDSLFLAFSSVNGFFGGFSAAAYSAANAYLDASAEAERQRGAPAASLAWSLWDDVGISRGYAMKDLSRSRGFLPIGMAEGRASMLAALHAGDGHLLIGLHRGSPHLRRFAESPARSLQQVVVAIRDESADVVNRIVALDVRDAFGQKVQADVRRDVPGTTISAARHRASESPGTDLERAVARIWQQVLDVDAVDLDSNFFELGGTSLLMAQAYRRMKDVTGPALVMTDLFRYPTVRTLCRYVAEGRHADPATQVEADRDRGRRRQERLRRPPRPVH
jgi:NADP-dependent 3-hydroxy acid dehydrogenase YdfG